MKSLSAVLVSCLLAALALCAAVPPPEAAALSFAAHADYATGAGSHAVALGDFNANGTLDLVTANFAENTASLMLGSGSGSFTKTANDPGTGPSPCGVAVADFNGDLKPDLAVAASGGTGANSVNVLIGDGSGGFAGRDDFTTGALPRYVVASDFNQDGKPDLATANWGASSVSVLLNTTSTPGGALTFATKVDISTGSAACLAAGDLNGDGEGDLITGSATNPTGPVSVRLGAGDGTFAAATDFSSVSGLTWIAVSDVSGDGKQDVVTTSGSGKVGILLGNGSGGLGVKSDFTAGIGAAGVAFADFNGDGKRDLVTANTSAGSVSVLLGNGSGRFAPRVDFTTASAPSAVATGDVNKDGRADIVTANAGAENLSVLRNTSTKPKIGSLSPARGRVGIVVTITGSGFAARRGGGKVTFGAKAATKYVSWSATRIKVRVPTLPKGSKAVRVKTDMGISGAKYFKVLVP